MVSVAQLEERFPVKELVAGASPVGDPMSYKTRKLKKKRINQLKYKLKKFKIVLLKKTAILRQKARSSNVKKKELFQIQTKRKEGQMFEIKKVIEVLVRYDRLSGNPDIPRIEKAVTDQLQKDGLLRLCVFVCPKFDTKALFSTTPEKYMPIKVDASGLFEPRIPKILSLRKDLMKLGLPTEINLIIGDNDAEEYIFPFIKSLVIDEHLFKQRQITYRVAFEQKCQRLFGSGRPGYLVWSLAENSVSMDKVEPAIPQSALQKEINFFKWLFLKDGPYRGALRFSEEILVEMVNMKYKLYGAQGKFLEILGGILLQTEGPGIWLERTNMLKSTGSSAIPAIYPWIRKKEILS